MSMTRALVPLLLILVLAAPGALAKSTALEAAPTDTEFGLVIRGLGQVEPMLNEHVDTMERYGLDAPNIEMFLDMIRETSPRLKGTRGPIATELGLTETGALAIYALPGETHDPRVVAVMDVKERKKVIKTVKWLLTLEGNSHNSHHDHNGHESPKSKKPKPTVHVKKERIPGKGLLMTFQKSDSKSPLYLRFEGDLAAFSDNLKAIEAVQFEGGEPFLGSGVVADARLGFYAGLSTAGPIAMKILPSVRSLIWELTSLWTTRASLGVAASMMKNAQLHALFQGGRYEAKLDMEVEPDLEPFVSMLRPGASGKAARAAMSKLITDRTDTWWRVSLDLKALETLARNLLGKSYNKLEETFERISGLPLDLVNRGLTGDQLIRCDGSFSSCVFSAGILDAGTVESLIRDFFAIVEDGLNEKSKKEFSVQTQSMSEVGEARHMVTTVSARTDLQKKADFEEDTRAYVQVRIRRMVLIRKVKGLKTNEEKTPLWAEINALDNQTRKMGLRPDLEYCTSKWQSVSRDLDYGEQRAMSCLNHYLAHGTTQGWDPSEAELKEERRAQASRGKKRRAKKRKKAEPFQPLLKIHWGMTDKLVVFGTTPHAVQTAMKASSESAPPASGGKFDDLTVLQGYQARGGLMDIIRQGVPAMRALLPKDFIPGAIIRMIDGLLVTHDEWVGSESTVRVTPTNVTIRAAATSLPARGHTGYSARISEAYTRAMTARYGGDLSLSNEQLAKLALEHPNTPWGQKAKDMVFRTELTGFFFNLGYLNALYNNPIGRELIDQLEHSFGPMIEGVFLFFFRLFAGYGP